MEKISWTENSEVLKRVEEVRCIINMIKQWKHRWLGHVDQHDVSVRDILEGRITGKWLIGRMRQRWWAVNVMDLTMNYWRTKQKIGRKNETEMMSSECDGSYDELLKNQAEDWCFWTIHWNDQSHWYHKKNDKLALDNVSGKFCCYYWHTRQWYIHCIS